MRAVVGMLVLLGRIGLAGRCSPQLLRQTAKDTVPFYDPLTNTTYNVSESIPPRPEMADTGQMFTLPMKTGQLCFTGAASGTINHPLETCSCNRVSQLEQKLVECATVSEHYTAKLVTAVIGDAKTEWGGGTLKPSEIRQGSMAYILNQAYDFVDNDWVYYSNTSTRVWGPSTDPHIADWFNDWKKAISGINPIPNRTCTGPKYGSGGIYKTSYAEAVNKGLPPPFELATGPHTFEDACTLAGGKFQNGSVVQLQNGCMYYACPGDENFKNRDKTIVQTLAPTKYPGCNDCCCRRMGPDDVKKDRKRHNCTGSTVSNFNRAEAICQSYTVAADPPTVYPSEDAAHTATKPAIIHVYGKRCDSPQIEVGSEERELGLIAPWEYNHLDSGESACTCPLEPEFISITYEESDGAVGQYVHQFKRDGNLKAPSAPSGGSKTGASGAPVLGSCKVVKAGFGWSGTQKTGLPVSGQGEVPVGVNETQLSIPTYKGSGFNLTCQGIEDMNTRINFCLYGLKLPQKLNIMPENIADLSRKCSDPDVYKPSALFYSCCMQFNFTRGGKTTGTTMIRRDMLVAMQCGAATTALNSGNGRYFVPPEILKNNAGIFQTEAERQASGGGPTPGQFMPDVPEFSLLRTSYGGSGYNDVCIPPTGNAAGIAGATCHSYAEMNLEAPEGATPPGCSTFNETYRMTTPMWHEKKPICSSGVITVTPGGSGTNNNNKVWPGESGWARTNAGQLASLRRAAASWDKCILPSSYATSGESLSPAENPEMGISPCDVAKYFNVIPQVYAEAANGWTAADFGSCVLEDVPMIVRSLYKTLNGPSTDAPTMLRWWASMPPQFYIGSSSLPAALSDYFTPKARRCLPNVPGRSDQGPAVPDSGFGDPNAVCSTATCCAPGITPENINNACIDSCNTGNPNLEQVFATLFNQSQLDDLFSACLAKDKNSYVYGDPNDSKRFCVFAGQYVDNDKTAGPLYKDSGKTHPLFTEEKKPTMCDDTSTGRVLSVEGDSLVFVSTAPRLVGTPIHPIFQTAFNIGGSADLGEPNYRQTDGKLVEPKIFNSELLVTTPTGPKTGIRFPIQLQYPEDEKLASPIIGAWNGIELNLIVASSPCAMMNHREARDFSEEKIPGTGTIIKIPGLYPRWIDIQQGGPAAAPNVDSCLTFDPSGELKTKSGKPASSLPITNWATHGDRFGIDLYNTGGGTALASKDQAEAGFMLAHAIGYYGDGNNADKEPQYAMLPTNGFCVVVNPNRCNAQCDMAKFETSMIMDAVILVVGGVAMGGALGIGAAAGEAAGAAADAGVEGGLAADAANPVFDISEDAADTAADGPEEIDPSTADLPADAPAPAGTSGGYSRFIRPTLTLGLGFTKGGLEASVATHPPPDAPAPTPKSWSWGEPVTTNSASTTADLYVDIRFAGVPGSDGSASSDIPPWKQLFNADLVLNTTKSGGYLFTTKQERTGLGRKLFEIYRRYPSMRRACHYSTSTDQSKCIAGEDYEPIWDYWTNTQNIRGAGDTPFTPASTAASDMYDNPDYYQGKNRCPINSMGPRHRKSGGTETSWWAGAVSMLEPTPVGVQIGCAVNDKAAGGAFKMDGNFAKFHPVFQNSMRQSYSGPKDDTISFVLMDEAILKAGLFKDMAPGTDVPNQYVAVGPDNKPINIVSDWGPRYLCGLCANIGAAAKHSPRRPECTIGTDKKFARYEIEESLGVADFFGNEWLTENNFYTPTGSKITNVNFSYYGAGGALFPVNVSRTTSTENNIFTGNSLIERLLGVSLKPDDTYMHGVAKPPCFGDLQSYEAPFCEIDETLFTADPTDQITCKPRKQSYPTTCPNPRWSNDERITLPSPNTTQTVGSQSELYDPLAASLSYCSNGPWSFNSSEWYKGPIITSNLQAVQNDSAVFNLSTFNTNTTSGQFVRCESDRMSNTMRQSFCEGSKANTIPEGYLTNFGIVAGIKTTIDSVCTVSSGSTAECILYANDTMASTFNSFQRIIDSFPDHPTTSITIHAVPVAARIMSKALLLFMTSVSTLYYSDASNVGTPSAFLEASGARGGILGQKMNVSWAMSEQLFGGMCHAEPSLEYFAHLYAVVEKFRQAGSRKFEFVNFEGFEKTRSVKVTEAEVYPFQISPPITAGLRRITLVSAFGPSVAKRATEILNSTAVLPERKFKFGGVSDQLGRSCTRVVLQEVGSTVTGFEFNQGGICTRFAAESARVPIMAGGRSVADSTISGSTCVDCAAGLFVAAGGDIALGTDVTAANMDVEGVELRDTEFIWTNQNNAASVATKCADSALLSTCQNASYPGTEYSFARIMGNPIVPACPASVDGEKTSLSPFCDVIFNNPGVQIESGQVPGGAIASIIQRTSGIARDNTTCSNACNNSVMSDFRELFGDPEDGTQIVDECCDGKFISKTYTRCGSSDTEDDSVYLRTRPPTTCSPRNCLWNPATDPEYEPDWINQTGLTWNQADFDLISETLCGIFYSYCNWGVCEDADEGCDRCASNKTFSENCFDNETRPEFANTLNPANFSRPNDIRKWFAARYRQPLPCAETGYVKLTDGTTITGSDPTKFTSEVISDVLSDNFKYEACSPLGCPNAIGHQSSPGLSDGIPVCISGNTTTPAFLHQTWLVESSASGEDGNDPSVLPPIGPPVTIFSPATGKDGGRPRHRLSTTAVDQAGTNYTIKDTYDDAINVDANRANIFTAQIGILRVGGGVEAKYCLSRSTARTATGTEYGGPLESRPCDLVDASQTWTFVFLAPIQSWRVQVPRDAFMCMTLRTQPPLEGGACGLTSGTCYTEPHPVATTADQANPADLTPTILPCFPCAVGVDIEGTGSGPVVSSVLALPSILVPEDTNIPANAVRIPLSTENRDLALVADLETGLCYATELQEQSFMSSATSSSLALEEVATVPCSVLEGVPLAQLRDASSDEDVCTDAAGLLVAACTARQGGLSFVDAKIEDIQNLCRTRANPAKNFTATSASGGSRAVVRCLQPNADTSFYTLQVMVAGIGYRDKDPLTFSPQAPGGTFHARVKKILWQPHSSAESVASAPITSMAVEVVNISSMFDLIGADNLYTIYAAGISSTTSAWVIFGIETTVIITGIAYHAHTFFKRKR